MLAWKHQSIPKILFPEEVVSFMVGSFSLFIDEHAQARLSLAQEMDRWIRMRDKSREIRGSVSDLTRRTQDRQLCTNEYHHRIPA